MARYKKTKSITLKEDDYSESVLEVNRVAKERNRSVHETAAEILLEACKSQDTNSCKQCQGAIHV